MNRDKKKTLTSVGAGISGLCLAYLLQEDFEITIIEARERVGGRIHSIDGHDMGPSWIWPHHRRVLSLVEKLGLNLFRQYTKGYALYDTKERVEHFEAPSAGVSFRVVGSLTNLVDTLQESLQGVSIVYEERVEKISIEAQRVLINTQKERYESDYLVLTLPPRLVANLKFTPTLPQGLLKKLQATQTWMGSSAKCVVEFKTPFWRERGLSGFIFSHAGPLGEIHDACTQEKAALFGFVNLHSDMQNIKENVIAQMIRIFDIDASEILNIYLVDWKKEALSAVTEDAQACAGHPHYGIDTSAYSERVFFSATEFSYEEGGYIEGAVNQVQKIAKQLLS